MPPPVAASPAGIASTEASLREPQLFPSWPLQVWSPATAELESGVSCLWLSRDLQAHLEELVTINRSYYLMGFTVLPAVMGLKNSNGSAIRDLLL